MVYLVVCGTAGAHESADVMSVWTTRGGAEAEADRLRAVRAAGGQLVTTYGGEFGVLEVATDVPGNQYLNDF
jgi:hypothetical protein